MSTHPCACSRTIIACFISCLMILGQLAPLASAATPPNRRSVLEKKSSSSAANETSPVSSEAPVAPNITATLVDSFPDVDADGKAIPGETITYTSVISNTGSDATGVQFSDTIDPNTTLVAGSLKISPLAIDDSYLGALNTPLSVGAPGVLTNDTGTPAPTAVPIAGGSTTGGGTVTLNADGSFMYNPAAGFTGPDTFTYTATNGQAPNNSGTVTINIDAPPSVTATTPTNGATDQALNANISITFSEPVDVTGDWFQVVCGSSGTRNVADTIVSGGPTTFTINPNTDFTTGEMCTVTVFAAQVSDQDANDPPDMMAANFVFSFSVSAEMAPSITATTPMNGATGVVTNNNLSITFSEPVNVSGNWFQVVCGTSGTRNVADTVVTGGPTTFTINPNADFAQNEMCTVTVFAAQVTDQDANDPPDNMAANFVFSFTTDAAPSVTATTPTNGATNQLANTDLTVTFSEPVNATGNWFQIVCGTSGTRNVADTIVSGGPTTFTINPNADFTGGETCTVTIFAAQITDQDANDPPDNMSANFVFSFTIDAGPSVTSTTPTNGATQQANNTNISLTFSEPVNVSGNWFQVVCASSGTRNVVDTVVSGGPTTFTINPNVDFTNGELCTVTVFAAQVTDQDSNDPPDNMSANFVFSFTIDSAPSVSTTVPANNDTGISADTNLTITFSEAVNVTGNWFQIVCGGQTKNPADTAVTGGPTTFTINPTTDLLAGNICQVTVFAAQVTDQDSGDPPDNMTTDFVFSFSVPPVAVNDTYAPIIIGNVGVNTATSTNFTVLTNDTPNTGVTINQSGSSLQGGTVVMAADGKFSYTPPAGYEGADSFTYTIDNASGTSNSATVSLTVAGMIWFINSAAGAGNGRLATPFNSVASFQAINNGTGNNPAAGDNIFIYENASSYTGPITLLSNQKLIGQDATTALATIAGVTQPADSFPLPAMNIGGPATTLNSSAAAVNAVNLNSAGTTNIVRGLALTTGSSTSKGISGTTFGTLTTAELTISGSGPALDLSTGSLSGSFTSISSSGGANGIKLNAIGGSSTLGTGALSGATTQEFLVTGGNLTVTYTGSITQNNAGRLVDIQNTTGGTITFNTGTLTAGASSTGVNINTVNGNVSFANLNLGTSGSRITNQAVTITNGTGTYALGAVSIFTSGAQGIVATGADGTVNISSGTVDSTNATAINIDGPAGLTTLGLAFTKVSATNSTTNGILVQDTNGSFTVSGTGSAGTGGTIQNNTQRGARFSNATNVNLSWMTFTGNGTANLDAAGTCGDDANGTNTNCAAGIDLQNVSTVNLSDVTVSGGAQIGINGKTLNGLSFTNVQVSGAGNEALEDGVQFAQLTGTNTFTSVNFHDNASRQLAVQNSSGTATLNITGSTFSNANYPTLLTTPSSATAAQGILYSGHGSATMTLNIQNSTFSKNFGAAVFSDTANTASMTFTVNGGTISGNGLAIQVAGVGSGPMNYTLTGVAITVDSNAVTGPISFFRGGVATGNWTGLISGNTLGTSGVPFSGSPCTSCVGMIIENSSSGPGSHNVTISNNTIRQTGHTAIHVATSGSGSGDVGAMNAKILNNNIGEPSQAGDSAIMVLAGDSVAGDTSNVCADVSGNTITNGVNAWNPAAFIAMNERFTNVLRLPGFGGGTGATAATFVSGQNGGVSTVIADGDDNLIGGGAACFLILTPGGIEGLVLMSSNDRFDFLTNDLKDLDKKADIAISLSQEQLDSIVSAAVGRWSLTGLTQQQVRALQNLKFELGDLDDSYLGEASDDHIIVDGKAQGNGWFVDPTPQEDSEFGTVASVTRRYTNPTNTPAGHIDLLTTIEHEMGHKLGLTDSYTDHDRDSLMYGYLTKGERRLPGVGEARAIRSAGIHGKHFLRLGRDGHIKNESSAGQQQKRKGGIIGPRPILQTNAGETVNPTIGTLPTGESVTVTFQVTVNTPYLGGANVSNQGIVSGSNFSNVLTDDPAVGGANDPTLTPINAPPNINISDAQANEPLTGSASMLFIVSLTSPAPASGVTVHYSTADQTPGAGHAVAGTDYAAVPDTVLSFASGEQVKTVSVNILSEADAPEPDETFLLNLSNATNGVIVDNQAVGTIKQGNASGSFLISELRTSGPGGAGDDFVELYNNTNSPLTVAASDASAGYGVYKMGADCNAGPVLIATIPNGTVIPARGHYLLVGSAYSLANYGGTGAAAGNLTLTSDIESDRNVAVFSTANALAVSSANRLDAVGFGTNTGGVCDLLREGTTLPALGGSTTEHSYQRDICGKGGSGAQGICASATPVDSNNNATDFLFADAAATVIGGVQRRLGAPGPENSTSPLLRNTILANLLDQSVAAAAAPNRVRDLAAGPTATSTAGTMSIRRRWTNNTGATVTRLRFRIIDISSLPSPGGGIADLRAITSADVPNVSVNDAATCAPAAAPCMITVLGTTLEQPPTQAIGGALNSTLASGTITLGTPLANSASINLQFLLGVQQTGTFKFYIIVEALP